MSETQTDAPGEQQAGRGKHRGQAADAQESQEKPGAGHGRHRRPAQDTDQAA